VLVAQHMPAAFTRAFGDALISVAALEVVEAAKALGCQQENSLSAGAERTPCLQCGPAAHRSAAPENPEYLWHPSVELLGRSALQHYDPKANHGGAVDRMGHDDRMRLLKSRSAADRRLRIRRLGGGVRDACGIGQQSGASLVLAVEKIAGAALNVGKR